MSIVEQRPTTWVVVCEAARLVPDRGVAALVDGEPVAIFRLSGIGDEGERWFGIDHIDPRSGAAVMARGLVGSIDRDGVAVATIASPIYKQRYDLATGDGLDDDTELGVWTVRCVDGIVSVATRPTTIIDL